MLRSVIVLVVLVTASVVPISAASAAETAVTAVTVPVIVCPTTVGVNNPPTPPILRCTRPPARPSSSSGQPDGRATPALGLMAQAVSPPCLLTEASRSTTVVWLPSSTLPAGAAC